MPKRTTTLSLALAPRDAHTTARDWLAGALRGAILDGKLRPGARLPSTRDLGHEYGLSRGTIVSAFEQLKSEGYVAGTVGSGTFVNQVLPDELLRVRDRASRSGAERTRRKLTLSSFGRRVQAFDYYIDAPRAFRTSQPAVSMFPTALWAQISARRWRSATTKLLMGCEPAGYSPLREAIAEYLRTSRGVNCTATQVLVVSGVSAAFDLVARMFVEPGSSVAIENPGYSGATTLVEALGGRVVSMPVDGEGVKVPARVTGVRLAYVTPAHQFPLGVHMSAARRLALLEWARKSATVIFEDDYDSEYRYSGRPLPALQGLDPSGNVIFAGTFNKVLFPSLRLGYLVVPDDLVDRFVAVQSTSIRHAPVLEQAVLCDFITEGHFARHVRRMREVYAERLSVLMESARQRLGGLLEISPVEAGLQTIGWLPDGTDDRAAVRAAAKRGIEVIPVSKYYRGPGRSGLYLGFAGIDAPQIRRGIRELEAALTPLSPR